MVRESSAQLIYALMLALFNLAAASGMHIKGSIALVTGATGGIGGAITESMVSKGVRGIGVVDLSDKCKQQADELNDRADRDIARAFSGDVADPEFRNSVFSEMRESFGPVNICVPAAGVLRDSLAVKPHSNGRDFDLYPEEQFRQVLDINLLHPTYWAMQTIASVAGARAANGLSRWEHEEGIQGVVVLIGSVSARGNRGQVSYSAAKSGLTGVSSTLNIEGLYHGVLTKIVHPGFVDTAMVDTIDQEYFDQHLKPRIGLGRKIRPEEIAEIVCSLVENDVLGGEVTASAGMTHSHKN